MKPKSQVVLPMIGPSQPVKRHGQRAVKSRPLHKLIRGYRICGFALWVHGTHSLPSVKHWKHMQSSSPKRAVNHRLDEFMLNR